MAAHAFGRPACDITSGPAQHAQPADDRVQRRAQLVRQRGQEMILRHVGALCLGVQGAVVHGERRPGRQADGQPLVPFGEDPDVAVSEEQPPCTLPVRDTTGTAR